MNKSTIYLDIEDDITAIIDKVRSAEEQIVALVPPKRMPVLQSAVNLKLLKKTAGEAKKRLVVITGDAALLPLAGSVGLHVAEDLKSRPYIPDKPEISSDKPLKITGEDQTNVEAPPKAVEDEAKPEEVKKGGKARGFAGLPKLKGKVPNFSNFRTKLILGISGLILLIVGWFFAYKVLPKASIVVHAQTSRIELNFDFTLDNDATEDDIEQRVFKPTTERLKKEFKVTVAATGEKNVGEKATGTMTIRNCDSDDSISVPKGTKFTSSGITFVSDAAATVPGGSFSGGGCDTPGEADVAVTAAKAGTSSNVASRTYSVQGFSTFVTGLGSAMSGGTNEIVKVVAQKDIDDAAEELEVDNHDEAQAELEAQFETTIHPLTGTFRASKGDATGVPAVGEEAEETEVTLVYNYRMYGVAIDSLNVILDAVMVEAIGTNNLKIYDNGLANLQTEADGNKIAASTRGFVGPEINEELLAEEVAGQRFSSAKELIEAKQGVISVDIDLSPFWVFSLPSASKIEITIDITEHALQ